MRRNSKILAMFLVLIMLGGMFYPHAAKSPAPPADTAPAAAPSEEPDSKAAVAETEGTEAIDTSQEVKLVMYLLGERTPDFDKVFDRINEKLKEKSMRPSKLNSWDGENGSRNIPWYLHPVRTLT